MKKLCETYKMGFNWRGLLLFAATMLPNLIWFFVPAPKDILRGESQTGLLDAIASAFQILTVFGMCAVVRKNAPKKIPRPAAAAVSLLAALYYAGWILYYAGVVRAPVPIVLAVAPAAALIVFSAAGKNAFALIPAVLFALCHGASAAINFVL